MKPPYENAVVVVTGASTGLGRAIAVAVADQGARAVIVNYASSEGDAQETARQVRELGAEAVVVQGDVGEDADCIAIAGAAAPYGRIDTLFCNAGKTTRVPAYAHQLDKLSGEDFLDVYRVNVVGTFQTVRACRALLEQSDRAAVVVTSSVAGVTGNGSSIAYSASKAALNTMVLTLARGLAPKIRINSVAPGFMDTVWFDKIGPHRDKIRESVIERTPLKVASTAEDIAGTALFLGSEASCRVTGETLIADAGLRMTGG
ncbi:SDR family NAD(P)-dependent oxidoreductase [Novosphingobium album (ex Hu et al. 2023)]|uniref:SDR family oxidoreductase n=1 Tax=Novosphingobium album (ex Hu et al. 2023) TaxID=2930093 RepID=A0ABT0B623_9SPHN|nr:SDR family NAD(P)-dependent oxidoreductase [Novosphingobium album (ex Hu et al. 2023)]MCJ2180303.1 SDR family oxidoreductase [Novosphingobium album (ex Hu et al. 2023)]